MAVIKRERITSAGEDVEERKPSGTESQTLHDSTYTWNLKTRTNGQAKQERNRPTENKLMDARWEGDEGLGGKEKGDFKKGNLK